MSYENHPIENLEKVFSLEQAKHYVERAAYEFDQATLERLESFSAADLRCIDDRASNASVEQDPPLAIPGAGLGLIMDAFGGLEQLERATEQNIPLDPAKVIEMVTQVIGPPTCHTDASSVERGEVSPCAGCGHCTGALKDPDTYLIAQSVRNYFINVYLPKLQKEIRPTVYPGAHNAKAVMIIDADDIGLPSKSEGDQVYVYHRSRHIQFLDALADPFVPNIQASNPDIKEAFRDAAKIRLAATVEHLAKDLPAFVVKRKDGAVEVSAATN